MIRLPKGQVILGDLKASFTQFDSMLAELVGNSFSGYVRVTSPGYDGILVLDSGQVIVAFDEWQGTRRSGSVAAREVAAQGRSREGIINVHKLVPEWVGLLAAVAVGEPIYGNLDTDVIDLSALVRKLEETSHSGCIQVILRDDGGDGLILMQDGKVVGSALSSEEELTAGEALPRILELAATRGAHVAVYRLVPEKVLSSGELVAIGLELPRLLEIWQNVLQCAEKASDSLVEKGAFQRTLRSELARRSRDQVTGATIPDLEYANGRLTLVGDPTPGFNRELAECLNETIDKLAARSGSINLRARIKISLHPFWANNPNAKVLGLDSPIGRDLTPFEQVLDAAIPFLGNSSERIVERQCREHLGIAPSDLKPDQLRELAQWIQVSSTLVISSDQARKLGQEIADLAATSASPPGLSRA